MEQLYNIQEFSTYEPGQTLIGDYSVGENPGEIVYDDGLSNNIIENVDLLYSIEDDENEEIENIVIPIHVTETGKWGLAVDGELVKDYEFDNIQLKYINHDTQEMWFLLLKDGKYGLYSPGGVDIPCVHKKDTIGILDGRSMNEEKFVGEEQYPVIVIGDKVFSIDGETEFPNVNFNDFIGYVNPETLVFYNEDAELLRLFDSDGYEVDFETKKNENGLDFAYVSPLDEYAVFIEDGVIVENPFHTDEDPNTVGYLIFNIKGMEDELYGNCIAVFANPVKNMGFGNMVSEGEGRETKIFSFPETERYIHPLVRLAQAEQIWHPDFADFEKSKIFEETTNRVVTIYKHHSLFE